MQQRNDPSPSCEPSDLAVPRTVEQPWMSLAEWRQRHTDQLNAPHRTDAAVLFLGDSITQGWGDSERFRERFGHHLPLNLGIGGDQTQHVLWRLGDGTLDGLNPRLLVLMIGVNNLGNGYSPEETVTGVRAVVAAVRDHLPSAQVLLLAILPAGQTIDDPLRRRILATNALLASLAETDDVCFLDVGSALLEADDTISPATMEDFLHPTPLGYLRLTDAVAPTIERLMSQG